MAQSMQQDEAVRLAPDKAAEYLLEECRMVLPGLQALFGFQLIAVFNARFATLLAPVERIAHLVALALVAIAIALVMAPAALHRQTDPHVLSDRFLRISTRLVLASMPALAIALALEFYLVTRVILQRPLLPALAAAAILAFFVAAWLVLPRLSRLRDQAR
jgi:hypothetical protein